MIKHWTCIFCKPMAVTFEASIADVASCATLASSRLVPSLHDVCSDIAIITGEECVTGSTGASRLSLPC
jgi:hypothetical protein